MELYFLGIFLGLIIGACLCFIVMKGRENKIVYKLIMEKINAVQEVQDVNNIYHDLTLSVEDKMNKIFDIMFKNKEK